MSAPDSLDEFDRFLSIECPVERYVSLGLAFERSGVGLYQTLSTLRKRGPSGLPPTRADLYR